jgi:hypothetical protein
MALLEARDKLYFGALLAWVSLDEYFFLLLVKTDCNRHVGWFPLGFAH